MPCGESSTSSSPEFIWFPVSLFVPIWDAITFFVVVVEVEEIMESGNLDPEIITIPCVLVDYLVKAYHFARNIPVCKIAFAVNL